jgi:hypothetical protein
MVILMKESKVISSAEQAVRRLAIEHPEWLPILEAATAVAARVEEHGGGEFAGAWVVDELARRGLSRWIPNLRILVSYGLLEKSGASTKGGRRAYYRMLDRAGVEEALKTWSETRPQQSQRTLRFVAAGASSDPPADAARRAHELGYEPRSWR